MEEYWSQSPQCLPQPLQITQEEINYWIEKWKCYHDFQMPEQALKTQYQMLYWFRTPAILNKLPDHPGLLSHKEAVAYLARLARDEPQEGDIGSVPLRSPYSLPAYQPVLPSSKGSLKRAREPDSDIGNSSSTTRTKSTCPVSSPTSEERYMQSLRALAQHWDTAPSPKQESMELNSSLANAQLSEMMPEIGTPAGKPLSKETLTP
ncbi:MAG: hypothetical protein QW356_08970, partial [Candidatus Hadarchaeales archaeon]